MGQLWRSTPQFKVEVGATEISDDSVSVEVVRIENAVSRARLMANDYEGKTFIGNLDIFANLKVSFRYGSDSWTKMFDGTVEDVSPTLTMDGQTVGALAYGIGRCLRNTYCNTSYGSESENPTIDTPQEIWVDLRDNYVQKSFDGAATGYSLGLSYAACAAPTIKYMHNPYRPCIEIFNQTLMLIQANEAGGDGHHWFVDTAGTMFLKPIDSTRGAWTKWWRTNQAGSTLTEGQDLINYNFFKRARSKDYANKIILCTDLRKPGYDYWCEDADTNGLWDETDADITIADDAVNYIVGADSLKFTAAANQLADGFYPSAAAGGAANWDFTQVGSQDSPIYIRFYARRTANAHHAVTLQLCTTDLNNYFYQNLFNTAASTALMPQALEWYQLEFPIRGDSWLVQGNPDWANIDFINVEINNTGFAGATDFWLDDLHFTGKIIREAYNSTAIGTYDEHQKIIHMQSSVDDSMSATDDTGMAGRLAYAELLTAQNIPVVGTVKTPGIIDILPGQWLHIHADRQHSGGTYRVDSDFRVKRIIHNFNNKGFTTRLELTDDMVNTFAKGPSHLSSVLSHVLFTDPEALSLKSTGIDPQVPRLSKDYP